MTLFMKIEAGGLLSIIAHKVHCETLPPTHTQKIKNKKE